MAIIYEQLSAFRIWQRRKASQDAKGLDIRNEFILLASTDTQSQCTV
tara:strand:- start:985 stop:1125 length:141 start_codon:yes stop_codon:yes gene_type:complete